MATNKRGLPKYVTLGLEVLALLSFLLTLYLLWHDRTASAGVAVALSFGALLFRMLPDLESFEILGLKAKLREQIQEAEEILRSIRDVASVNSKAAVLGAIYTSRWGGVPYKTLSQILDDQTRMLGELGVSAEAIRDAKRPALEMTTRDAGHLFRTALEPVLLDYGNRYGKWVGDLMKLRDAASADFRPDNLTLASERQAAYSYSVANARWNRVQSTPEELGRVLTETLDLFRLSKPDREVMIGVIAELESFNRRNWHEMRLAGDFEALQKKYPSASAAMEVLFPDGIAGPDWSLEGEFS